MNEILDKDLIKNYLNGDEKSLEILINKYLVSIYNFVFSFVKEKDSSEDVTQEVFIKIWKKLKKFNI